LIVLAHQIVCPCDASNSSVPGNFSELEQKHSPTGFWQTKGFWHISGTRS
jgi:hypothetical protein